uniref:Lethal(2) giant larvae protein homolog 1-like isoform X3 n=1 Tax=Saccoglossus kowalevskii TaxID=10224 RepID=A0ABM0MAR3_SACKO|nr:PREDICTED: lethal(2) giant larvae protein homolog 1-like isoform X3 [Saccoglossus kowalevskii]
MLRFIRSRGGGHVSAEREKQKKELFAFNKTVEHGFPNKPSSVSFDPKLKLLAVGTHTGVVKVYGAPGVEFIGVHKDETPVSQLFFLPDQGRIISLLENNTLHLWEVNIKDGNSVLEEVKEFSLEGRLQKITVCCLPSDCQHLFLGTEGGNIYVLDIVSFELLEHIIYQDVVMQNVPDDYKVNPGAVEAIAAHPTESNKLLIGYNRGLIVLWDNKTCNADQTYVGSQQLESLSWHRNGIQFMTAHNDGSYAIWNVNDPTKPEKDPTITYGPFPCKAITKVLWQSTKGEPFIMLSGGMPRASYGDRNCITVMQGKTQVAFDFTSRVLDFFTVSDTDEECEYDDPHSLVVLVEEELVVIDLQSEGWPTFNKPYLASLHASAITTTTHCSNVPNDVWEKIQKAGETQMAQTFSQREWPINGGKNLSEEPMSKDLLLTGHEDGTVRFWDASTVALKLIYKLNTSNVFMSESEHAEGNAGGEGDDDWPRFRKVGSFDPYSDDPRLGIQKIILCSVTGKLVVAGTAGQVICLNLGEEEIEQSIETHAVNIVSDRDEFVWKGHDQLNVKTDDVKMAPGFQANFVVQCTPPAAITALATSVDKGLLAVGTSHGYALFDANQKKMVITKCTLNPSDLSASGETPMSRRKSFKKSLRESFRRLRRRRSRKEKEDKPRVEAVPTTDLDAPTPEKEDTPAAEATEEKAEEPKEEEEKEVKVEETEKMPVERKVEARSKDDAMTSMVRSLYFASTFIRDANTMTTTFWAGTNAGTIYVYTISVPDDEKRDEVDVKAELGKEIRLKHHAPVVAMSVIDHDGYPLPDPIDVTNERCKAPNMSGGHSIVICSEEQFKVFSLPNLKPKHKHKLTAHDGSRVRKVSFINFRSRSDDNYSENCVTCLSNLGDLHIFSIPHLKSQLKKSAIRKEDITGISSCIFTCRGEGFYLLSPSEFERFSLSARYIKEPMCMLELKEGMRPTPPEPEPEPEQTEEKEKDEGEEKTDAETAEGEKDKEEEETKDGGEEEETPAATEQKTDDPEATAQEPDELVEEVDVILAKAGISDANDTVEEETQQDITVDEVKDYQNEDEGETKAGEGGLSSEAESAQNPTTEESSELRGEELVELQIKEDAD